MQLLQRQSDIIKYLKHYPEWHTGKNLAALFNVSIRTIRNDISIINQSTSNPIIVSSKCYGYSLTTTLTTTTDQEYEHDVYENRQLRILLNLILGKKDGHDLYDMAQALCISEHTLLHDIQALRAQMLKYPNCDLYLQKKKDTLYLEGNQEHVARLVQMYLKDNGDYSQFQKLQHCFEHVHFALLTNILKKELPTSIYTRHLKFEDFQVIASIFLEQAHHSNDIPLLQMDPQLKESLQPFFASISSHFPQSNLDYFTQSFLNFLVPFLTLEEKEYALKQSTTKEDELYPILVEIFGEVKDLYALDITNHHDLILDFLVHVKSTLLQIDEGVTSNNPLLEYIRLNYTFLFDVAFYIANRLATHLHFQFSKNEISFFVIYLISPLKLMKENVLLCYHVNILLYVIEGPSFMQNIRQLLNEKIENKHINMEMISSPTAFQKMDATTFDLLITTTTHLNENNIKICVVEPFINALNLKDINFHVNEAYQRKKQEHFHHLFHYFFHKDTFMSLNKVETPHDVFAIACLKLFQLDYVPINFEAQIMERESLISTAFETGVALPHTITNSSLKSNISFIQLDHPMVWGNIKVKSVFLFAIAKEDLSFLNLIYKIIILICSSHPYSETLQTIQDFQQFKDFLFEIYSSL